MSSNITSMCGATSYEYLHNMYNIFYRDMRNKSILKPISYRAMPVILFSSFNMRNKQGFGLRILSEIYVVKQVATS